MRNITTMMRELKKTHDHSPTLFIPQLNEHYHSINGAASESLHVFIKNGLDYVISRMRSGGKINILEVGMGTGLNACLTFKHSKNIAISYVALEPFPLKQQEWTNLDYNAWIDRDIFLKLHQSDWNCTHYITQHPPITFHKTKTTLQDFETFEKFDLVYFDAFAPNVQPELWTENIFSKIYKLLRKDGALVTYCAKGSVKRAMKASGFHVESLPGAPGKREMVRAIKKR